MAQHDRTELETEEGRKAFNDKCSASIAETIANGGTCIEAIHTACAKAAATPVPEDSDADYDAEYRRTETRIHDSRVMDYCQEHGLPTDALAPHA